MPYICRMLLDRFGRNHDYLRMSLTDKCNLRCLYCMPNEHYDWLPKPALMQPDEIEALAKIFVEFGITKIRLTGGEPLARPEFSDILSRLAKLPIKLAMTTNGLLLDRYLDDLKMAKLKSINLSLDTLKPERFKELTQRDRFGQAWQWIERLPNDGFKLKVNAVVMRDVNDDELVDFVALTQRLPIHVRFIEFMPFDGNRWQGDQVVTYKQMLAKIEERFDIEKLTDKPNATAKSYRVKDGLGTFAVISTVSQPFCSSCNRMRITAEGKMRNCLFSRGETDLLTALREGQDVRAIIQENILGKHKALGGLPPFEEADRMKAELSGRSMIKIGG